MQLKFRNLSQVTAIHDFDIVLVFDDRWIFGRMNRVDNEVLLDHVSGRVFLIDAESSNSNSDSQGPSTADDVPDSDSGDGDDSEREEGGYVPPLSEVLYSIFLGNDGILNADIRSQLFAVLAQEGDVAWTSSIAPFAKYTICVCGDSCSISDHFGVYRNANMANVLSWEA